MRLQEGVGELRILNSENEFLRFLGIWVRNGKRARVERKWMQAEDRAGDDAKSAEGAGDELGKIVASDVFDDFAAAAGERAVGESDGDADDEVAQRAKTQAE